VCTIMSILILKAGRKAFKSELKSWQFISFDSQRMEGTRTQHTLDVIPFFSFIGSRWKTNWKVTKSLKIRLYLLTLSMLWHDDVLANSAIRQMQVPFTINLKLLDILIVAMSLERTQQWVLSITSVDYYLSHNFGGTL
jgi:hypothetical protein